MAVVLDTDTLPPAERAEAVLSATRDAFMASYLRSDSTGVVAARMDAWTFGAASMSRSEMAGIQLVRTARHVRSCPAPNLAISVQEVGDGRFERGGEQHVIGTGHLQAIDENCPYEFSWAGRGASVCLFVPLDDLALPSDLIRDAATRLHTSPIYALMVHHIIGLRRHADALSVDPAAAGLGTSSVELARALLASAGHDTRYRADALAATLLTQIRGYVRQHLADPDLTPARIAAAQNISVRHLYKVCAHADFSLHQWITSQRLQGAREELGGLPSRHRSIAMIAQRWGFTNPTHFSRRFRATYGMTPREWRRLALQVDLIDFPTHNG